MGRIFTDDFNRVGATLGGDWTEVTAGILATNMSTDGADAILDANGIAVAIADGTNQTDQFVQCWMKNTAQVGLNNCGIVFKYQDPDNFYICRNHYVMPTHSIEVWRRKGGAWAMVLNAQRNDRSLQTIYRRLAVSMVGDAIMVFYDDEYHTTPIGPINHEGSIINVVDLNPIAGSGSCGIGTTGNNASGLAGGLRWSDFVAYDGEPETIYIDINGTRGVDCLGTESQPDLGLQWALNSTGLRRGGKIKCVNDSATPITNGLVVTDYTIGHNGKFQADGSEAWPEYDKRTGRPSSYGRPNLIIEGADVATDALRTLFRETRNVPFFTIRNDATYILFRGFDFDENAVGATSKLVRTIATNTLGASTEHSIAVDKCRGTNGEVAHGTRDLILIDQDFESVRVSYCELAVDTRSNSFLRIGNIAGTRGELICEFNVMHGASVRGILADVGPSAGRLWRVFHDHFIDLNVAAATCSCLELSDGLTVLGEVEVSDCIIATRGANPTLYGTRITANAGAMPGTVGAHHNGYLGIATPRDVGVDDDGNEIGDAMPGLDPAFFDEGIAYSWPQTEQSPAIELPSDWRPTALPYIGTASDEYLGIDLDRGALQVIVIPPGPDPHPIGRRVPDYCIRVTYDPEGKAIDLSDRLLDLRPIRQEKDIERRRYKISDTHLEISDAEGLFVASSPATIMLNDNGVQDWLNKPVHVELLDRNGERVFLYRGFLIGRTASRGKTRLRLGNRFQRLFASKFLANSGGQIVSTTNINGTPSSPPADPDPGDPAVSEGGYLADITPHASRGCGIETWTFTFEDATTFSVQGSTTGDDGTGTIGANFTSDSGRITVLAADWHVDPIPGAWEEGDKCSIKSVYRPQLTTPTTVNLFLHLLTNPECANLALSDIDPGVFDYLGSMIDHFLEVGYVIDEDIEILDELERVAQHMLAVVIEKTDATVGLYAYIPRLESAVTDILCRHTDLMAAAIEDTPVYNVFRYKYGYNEAEEDFDGAFTYPDDDNENASLALIGERSEAPTVIELKGFTVGDLAWIRSMAQQDYVRWAGPRPLWETAHTMSRLGIELDQIFAIDSLAPTATGYVEPSSLTRHISLLREPRLEGRFFDVTFYVQFSGQCGFLFHDVHPHDSCWVHF